MRRLILELIASNSRPTRFWNIYDDGKDIAINLLSNDLTRFNPATGLWGFASFIYRMDHAEWRLFHDDVHHDDIMVTIAQEPCNMDNSVCVSCGDEYAFVQCHAVCNDAGYFDYSELVEWLEDPDNV